ncbi:MAG: hypothetical protein WC712_03875 [Candidatus Brocadiia bacterium]
MKALRLFFCFVPVLLFAATANWPGAETPAASPSPAATGTEDIEGRANSIKDSLNEAILSANNGGFKQSDQEKTTIKEAWECRSKIPAALKKLKAALAAVEWEKELRDKSKVKDLEADVVAAKLKIATLLAAADGYFKAVNSILKSHGKAEISPRPIRIPKPSSSISPTASASASNAISSPLNSGESPSSATSASPVVITLPPSAFPTKSISPPSPQTTE